MALPDILRLSPYKTPGWPTGEPHIVIVHGTRGGALYGQEFDGTLNWFQSNPFEVSAHWVIGFDGRTARTVPDSHRANHAQEHNDIAIGIELEQPNASDQITPPQYEKLFLIGRTYYPSIPFWHLTTVGSQAGWIEHRETPQGIRVGKSDVGTFDWQAFLNMEDNMPTADEIAKAVWAYHLTNHVANAAQPAGQILGFAHLESYDGSFKRKRRNEVSEEQQELGDLIRFGHKEAHTAAHLSLGQISNETLQEIAEAVADEQARRMTG